MLNTCKIIHPYQCIFQNRNIHANHSSGLKWDTWFYSCVSFLPYSLILFPKFSLVHWCLQKVEIIIYNDNKKTKNNTSVRSCVCCHFRHALEKAEGDIEQLEVKLERVGFIRWDMLAESVTLDVYQGWRLVRSAHGFD